MPQYPTLPPKWPRRGVTFHLTQTCTLMQTCTLSPNLRSLLMLLHKICIIYTLGQFEVCNTKIGQEKPDLFELLVKDRPLENYFF